jgi:hypothetical protein
MLLLALFLSRARNWGEHLIFCKLCGEIVVSKIHRHGKILYDDIATFTDILQYNHYNSFISLEYDSTTHVYTHLHFL